MTEIDAAARQRFRRSSPMTAWLGVELVAQADGYARLWMPVRPEVAGGVAGAVHGGIVSALVDIAALSAMQTVFGADEEAAGTAELGISYLRPALGASVTVEARVLKKGRTLAVIDVDVKNPDGRLAAKARVSYALRPNVLTAPRG
ncbi:MAG: PaaI family thioesterase [Dehalococcoidia bacterium]